MLNPFFLLALAVSISIAVAAASDFMFHEAKARPDKPTLTKEALCEYGGIRCSFYVISRNSVKQAEH